MKEQTGKRAADERRRGNRAKELVWRYVARREYFQVLPSRRFVETGMGALTKKIPAGL
jgi:hypothetical protein